MDDVTQEPSDQMLLLATRIQIWTEERFFKNKNAPDSISSLVRKVAALVLADVCAISTACDLRASCYNTYSFYFISNNF